VDPSEIDAYEVRLGREDEDEFWRVWTDENSIAYDGAPLEPGAYWWFVSADTVRGNSIHAFTHFWIGPELRMWDLKVQSATKYDNDGSPEVIPEQLALAAKVFDVHGYQDVTVEVTLPTGGVVTLVDIEWVGSDYEAEYILDLQVETILAGSFTFTARDTHGNEVSQAVHFDTWYLEPLTYVSPDYMEGIINLRGQIVPIVSLHKLFGRPRPKNLLHMYIIIGDANSKPLGLTVDSMTQLYDIDRDQLESPAESEPLAAVLSWVAKLDDGIMFLLDLRHIATLKDAPELRYPERFRRCFTSVRRHFGRALRRKASNSDDSSPSHLATRSTRSTPTTLREC